MPKLKTHRGAAKRLKSTASGKLKRSKAYTGHVLTSKTTKRKRKLRKAVMVAPANAKVLKHMLIGMK